MSIVYFCSLLVVFHIPNIAVDFQMTLTILPQFKPIYCEHLHGVDDWDTVNPMECYRFKDGLVRLSKGGYWFPYRPILHSVCDYEGVTPILVNLTKPYVLV